MSVLCRCVKGRGPGTVSVLCRCTKGREPRTVRFLSVHERRRTARGMERKVRLKFKPPLPASTVFLPSLTQGTLLRVHSKLCLDSRNCFRILEVSASKYSKLCQNTRNVSKYSKLCLNTQADTRNETEYTASCV